MFSEPRTVSVLGVTGSVGQCAADVIAAQPELFDVQCVTAHTNIEALAEQACRLKAKKAVIADPAKYKELKQLLPDVEISAGLEALEEAAAHDADIVLTAITGIAGLKPLMRAITQGKSVAIANKEPLVAAGPLVMETAKKYGTMLLPVDSEHNAVFQCFDSENSRQIEKIILTASGGPFLKSSEEDIRRATPAQAINHPNWSMGKKISVDSATMMNKALEIIEAHYLFDISPGKIEVLIHPQSVIHSMVEYSDGSVLAQMAASDMRTPVAHVLGWPVRIATPGRRLDLAALKILNFEQPDMKKFPALGHAYACLEAGLHACVAFNAANEIAVEAFLTTRILFTDIMKCVEAILGKLEKIPLDTLDDIIAFDQTIREQALFYLQGITGQKAVSGR